MFQRPIITAPRSAACACPEAEGRLPDGTAATCVAGPCQGFAQVRAAAASDPTLGLLWDRLFDDANP
jgi:hypothetical protein